jgi:hypothetical protein
MMTAPMNACWSAESASAILRTEALEGDEAIFLATHSPVRGFYVGGSHSGEVVQATEEGLLVALSDPARHHAFCVVQGEPGSGKSHLIRWLSMNWAQEGDVVLLLQRADGSLDGALSQLQRKLPPEFMALFDGLGQRQKASIEGRSADFLSSLGNRLAPNYFEIPLDDAGWCGQHDVQSLILNAHIRSRWTAPRRILEVMDGKAGERNSETASFDLRDIIELAKYAAAVHDSGPSNLLARQLRVEALVVEHARIEGLSFDDVVVQRSGQVRTSLTLARALNLRRNDAVQNVIGVSAARLKGLFESVRVGLGRNGKRLILLLEDITSWEGLDDSLVDALVLNADTRDDGLCPLISVVGVTPRYYDQLQGNYRQRITHEIRLGEVSGTLQDVATMREADDRAAFMSRYLAATRSGLDALRSWRGELKFRRELPPPNQCIDCAERVTCHAVFGAVGEIGLFPFTSDAITGFFNALKTDDKGQTHRTPRGLVQHVLSPTLLNPKALDERAYPGPEIESWGLEKDQLVLSGGLRSLLQTQVEDLDASGRLQRVFALWGDTSRPEITADQEGRRLANVPEGIFSAFGLPWIGGDGQARPPASTLTRVVEAILPASEPDTTPGAPTAQIVPVSSRAPRGPVVSDRSARGQTEGQLIKLRGQVALARDQKTISDPALWHAAVFQVMSSLDWRKLGVDRWTWSRLFTSELIKIEGTGRTGANHFVLPLDDVLYDGLEAYAELKIGEASEELTDFHRRRLSLFMRRLESLVRTHMERRLSGLRTGEAWDAAGPIAQILIARAWLRRSAMPKEQLCNQWRDILSDEVATNSDSNSRTEPWREFLNATKDWHDRFRVMLREMVSLPQGVAQSFGLADAGMVAASLIAFKDRRPAFVLMSADALGGLGVAELDAVKDIAAKFRTKFSEIPRKELELLKDRARELVAALNGISIRARAARLDAVIRTVTEQLPGQALQPQKAWQEARATNAALLDEPSTSQIVQEWITDLVGEGEQKLPPPPALLDWLAGAPAANIKSARDLFVLQGAKLTAELLPIIRDSVRAGEGAVDLSGIQDAGAALLSAAQKASAVLQGGNK